MLTEHPERPGLIIRGELLAQLGWGRLLDWSVPGPHQLGPGIPRPVVQVGTSPGFDLTHVPSPQLGRASSPNPSACFCLPCDFVLSPCRRREFPGTEIAPALSVGEQADALEPETTDKGQAFGGTDLARLVPGFPAPPRPLAPHRAEDGRISAHVAPSPSPPARGSSPGRPGGRWCWLPARLFVDLLGTQPLLCSIYLPPTRQEQANTSPLLSALLASPDGIHPLPPSPPAPCYRTACNRQSQAYCSAAAWTGLCAHEASPPPTPHLSILPPPGAMPGPFAA